MDSFINKATGGPSEASKEHHRLSVLLLCFIFVMVAFNAYFTFEGAKLVFNGNIIVAGGLAFAVQAGIGLSLSALPHVSVFKKLYLIFAYIVALLLSLSFAYTYVFQEKTADQFDEKERLVFADKVSSKLNAALSERKSELNASRLKIAELERSLNEEKNLGLRSGHGPGAGPVYYKKLEDLEAKKAELAIFEENLTASETKAASVSEQLQGDFEPNRVLIESGAVFTSLGLSSGAQDKIIDVEEINFNRNPVDKALDSLRNFSKSSGDIIISILIAVVFDLLALLFGVVRYLILSRDNSISESIYGSAIEGIRFFFRMGDIFNHAKAIHDREKAASTIKISEAEAKSFFIAVFSKMAIFDDTSDPDSYRRYPSILKYLFSLIRPLHLEKKPQARGILHSSLEKSPVKKDQEEGKRNDLLLQPSYLKPLIGELLSRDIFENDLENRCYLYNEGSNAEHFIAILNQMSLQSSQTLENILAQGAKKGSFLVEGRFA
ncbi:MAG: hypothetical protein RQ824_11885 [bacterium]|nr:hypothetical protein [bacterium]